MTGWEDRVDRGTNRLAESFELRPKRTGLRVLLTVVGVTVVIGATMSVVGLATGWGGKAVKVVSPANVQKQYAVIIDDWNSLSKAAYNACMAQGATPDPNSPTMVESPALAYAATYRNIQAHYNSAWDNVFKAGLVGPAGYPRHVDTFPELTGPNPDFCAVSMKLNDLRAAE